MRKFEYIVSDYSIHLSLSATSLPNEIDISIMPVSSEKTTFKGSLDKLKRDIANTQLLKFVLDCVKEAKQVCLLSHRQLR